MLRSKQREVEMQKLQLRMAQLELEEIEDEEKSETSSRHSNFKIESREVKDKEKYKHTEQWINQKMTVENRRNYVQENGLCFKCLVPGHTVKKCFRNIVCNIGECRGRHNRLVHIDVERADKTNEPSEGGDRTDKIYSALLKIVKVKLYGQENNIETYALLDEGSTVTLIDSSIAEILKLDGPTSPICLQWTNQMTQDEEYSKMEHLEIADVESGKKFRLRNARTVKNLTLPKQKLDIDFICEKYDYIDRYVLEMIEIVLTWIRSETNRLKSFEAHRIQEIVNSTEIKKWRWVPSSINPADLGTKENYDFNSSMDSFWMKGPPILKQQDIYWPQEMKFKIENEQVNLIMHSEEWSLPDEQRFSKWSRLLRATGWILRFVRNMKDKDRRTGELQPEELEKAENIWWRKIQALLFKEEIGLLEKGQSLEDTAVVPLDLSSGGREDVKFLSMALARDQKVFDPGGALTSLFHILVLWQDQSSYCKCSSRGRRLFG
ncbi:hypothetical protein JTB14_021282 [Gonioctena quinquepunctata]|nr:hypothetical protein JTB14_021282 [Gonioctena quinquepunctata]